MGMIIKKNWMTNPTTLVYNTQDCGSEIPTTPVYFLTTLPMFTSPISLMSYFTMHMWSWISECEYCNKSVENDDNSLLLVTYFSINRLFSEFIVYSFQKSNSDFNDRISKAFISFNKVKYTLLWCCYEFNAIGSIILFILCDFKKSLCFAKNLCVTVSKCLFIPFKI